MSVDAIENGVVEADGEAAAGAADAAQGDPGPAAEDEREDALQAIYEAAKAVDEAELEATRKAEAAKAAKKVYEARVEDLRRIITDSRRGPGPLFERKAETSGAVVKEAFEALLSVGNTEEQARRMVDRALASGKAFASVPDLIDWIYKASTEPAVADDESWRGTPLSALGLKPGIVESLAEGEIVTLGELADWTAAGESLESIKGLGPAKVAEIEAATERFWAGRGGALPDPRRSGVGTDEHA